METETNNYKPKICRFAIIRAKLSNIEKQDARPIQHGIWYSEKY